MLNELLKSLDVISPLLLLICIHTSKKIVVRRDFFYWFIVTQAVLNNYAYILDQHLDKDNLYVYHINCAISFLIISEYFQNLLSIRKIKLVISFILLFFIVFYIVNVFLWEDFNTFNSNSLGLASFIIILYCFLYYREQIIHPATKKIIKSRNFWYVTALFTYFSSSFFIFITYRYLTQSGVHNLGILWKIHNVFFFIMSVYIFIGFLCQPSQKKYK